MRYYVIINGVNSLTIEGLAIRTLPPISKPAMRNIREEIDGRDGDITTELGYGAYDKTLEIGLFGDYDIDRIISFFNTKGTIIFSDEPDKYYNFEIVDKIDYTKLVKFRTATINIHCQPFKYPVSEEPQVEEYEYVEATGTNITLDNTSEGIFNKIELLGNTEQTQYAGNNLLDISKVSSVSGGAISNEVFTQTAVNGFIYFNNGAINVSNGDTIYISIDLKLNANSSCSFNALNDGVNATYTKLVAPTPAATFQRYQTKYTYTANATINRILIQLTSITGSAEIKNIMISKNSSISYEPYVGGIPSPNPNYPQDIHVVSGDNEIAICGKNLYYTDSQTKTFTASTESWKYLDGTSGADHSNPDNTLYKAYVEYGKTYTFTCSITASASVSSALMYYDNTVIQTANGTDLTYNKTFTAGKTGYIIMRYYVKNGISVSISNVQLEQGNQATTYEAYIGNSYPLYLGVENLWKNQLTGFLPQSGSYPTTSSSYPNARYVLVNLLTGQSITLSGSTSNLGRVRYIDKDTNQVVGMVDSGETAYYKSTSPFVAGFTEGTITAKKEVIIGIMDMGGAVNNLVVNYGTTPQYISDTPIELCKIGDYQDYTYKDNGSWYLHKEIGKIVLDGSESWYNAGGNAPFGLEITDSLITISDDIPPLVYCDKFYQVSQKATWSAYDSLISTNSINNSTKIIRIRYASISDLENFKTWLSTHNTILYYVLATPTNTLIEDTTLIDQLEAIKNATSYKGRTNISQTNNDMPFILDLSALKENSDHLVIDNIGNIYSKPTLDLEGTGIVDIYLNDTQMFEVDLSEKNEIVIDTQAMEAYNPTDNTLANRQVTGDYSKFKLDSGENDLRFSGDLTKATITRYERWL